MKKKFKFLLLMVLIIPISVNARTQEEANAILDSFEDTIHLKSIDKADALDDEEWANYSRDTAPLRLYYQRTNKEMFDFLFSENSLMENGINYYNEDNNDDNENVTITVSYTSSEPNNGVSKTIHIVYDEIDETLKNNAKKIIDEIPNEISLKGLNAINYLYHYGEFIFGDSNIKKSGAIFPELKKIIEKHQEYEYEILGDRGGGTPYFMERNIYIGLFKEDVLYGIKEVVIDIDKMILVDKEETGTILSKAENRLKNYYKKDNDFIFDTDDVQELPVNEIKEYTGLNDVYGGVVLNLTIGGNETTISIIETNSEILDKIFVESLDSLTGINVYTECIDVPADSIVKTKDVLDEDYVKKAIQDNNLKLYKAFDIDLEKYSDKTLIKTIEGGLEVYIPTDKGNVGDKVLVYYINEDGEKSDTIDGEIVKVDNQLYVKFVTNHLSTYAIDENVIEQKKTKNPQTGDNLLYLVSLFIISSSILLKNKKA